VEVEVGEEDGEEDHIGTVEDVVPVWEVAAEDNADRRRGKHAHKLHLSKKATKLYQLY